MYILYAVLYPFHGVRDIVRYYGLSLIGT